MKLRISIILIFNIITSVIIAKSPYIWEKYPVVYDCFQSIDNCDSINVMAVASIECAFKEIIKSTDAGLTWFKVYNENPDTASFIRAKGISYPTKNFCIIACDSGIFIKTTDGGITWDQTRTEYKFGNFGFNRVSMFDDKNGVMSGGYDMIISHDGFETWDSVKLPEQYLIGYHQMFGPNIIYLMAFTYNYFNQRFLKSYDGGKSWIEYPYPDPHPEFFATFNMKFADSLFGYTVGGESRRQDDSRWDMVFRTTDGGITWDEILDTFLVVPYGLSNLDVLDRNNAIFVGPDGKIYWTHDGGASFIYDSCAIINQELAPTSNVALLCSYTAIFVNFVGGVFRSSLATDIGETIVKSYYHISPNPASGYIDINLSNQTLKGVVVDVRIYDVLGMEVQKSMDSRLRGNELC